MCELCFVLVQMRSCHTAGQSVARARPQTSRISRRFRSHPLLATTMSWRYSSSTEPASQITPTVNARSAYSYCSSMRMNPSRLQDADIDLCPMPATCHHTRMPHVSRGIRPTSDDRRGQRLTRRRRRADDAHAAGPGKIVRGLRHLPAPGKPVGPHRGSVPTGGAAVSPQLSLVTQYTTRVLRD